MDPLSHALLGAASGRALAREHGRAAALAGFAGAMLPDADVFIRSAHDPLLNIEFHRHFSHTFVFAPAGALIMAAIVWLVLRRRVPFTRLYLPALAGFVSAILLDACTSYGTRLLLPFTDQRYSWSVIAVVDPLFTLILLAGVVTALRTDRARPAAIALTLALLYLGFGWVQRERAEDEMMAVAADRGHRPARLEVKPTMGNLLLWRSIYESDGRYVVDGVRIGLTGNAIVYPGAATPRVTPEHFVPPLMPDSLQVRDLERFSEFSEGYLIRHPGNPNVVGDVRYALLPNSLDPVWGVEIFPSQPDRHVSFETYRDVTPEIRHRFVAMLKGAAPEALH